MSSTTPPPTTEKPTSDRPFPKLYLHDVSYLPNPDDPNFPPWYRSSAPTGRPRKRFWRIAGYVIENQEGRRWTEKHTGMKLADDHSMDPTIFIALYEFLEEAGFEHAAAGVPRRDVEYNDYMAVTQRVHGECINRGPDGVDEVLDPELMLQEDGSEEERKMREFLAQHDIKTFAFKTFFR